MMHHSDFEVKCTISFKSVGIGFALVFLVSIIIGSVACVPVRENSNALATLAPTTIVPTNLPITTEWAERWLRGIPCRLPCWEEIIPGRTSAIEAVDLLAKSPLVGTVHTTANRLFPDRAEVNWTWSDGSEGGRAIFDAQAVTQTVYAIQPTFPTRYRLQDVISALGNPSHVIATALRGPDLGSPISYDLSIIYLPLGLRLHTSSSSKPVTLNSDTKFEDITFSDPSRKELTAPQEFLVLWEGLKNFGFYCKDEENGNACRGNQ
jgi:hypothetical protein